MAGFYDTDIAQRTECFKPIKKFELGINEKGARLGFEYIGKIDASLQPLTNSYRVRVSAKTEAKVLKLMAKAVEEFPKIVKYLDLNNVADFLNRCQSAIKASSNVDVNLMKAFVLSERINGNIYKFLSFLHSGLVNVGDVDRTFKFTASRGVVMKKNRILLLNAHQRNSSLFMKTGKYSGVFKGKPAITEFNTEALNEVAKHLHLPNYRNLEGARAIIAAYGLKKPKLKIKSASNILDEDKSLILKMDDEDIACEFENGNLSAAEIKQALTPSRINNINAILKRKVATIL